ncbi:MAG: DUF4249 domain-containing protein [Salinivirgaceae bacterium]
MKQIPVSKKFTKKELMFFLGLVCLVIVVSCIEPFFINDEVGFEPVLVVDALITDEHEEQQIVISETTSLIEYSMHAVHNCQVVVSDKDGNEFTFTENFNQGNYQGTIPFEFLVPGNAFKIVIQTSAGKLYESDFEAMTSCAEIDSVYYDFQVDTNEVSKLAESVGLQFYVDLRTHESDSKFYRWQVDETYEYHSTWPIDLYWDGEEFKSEGPNYSFFTCYKNESVKRIYTATTKNVDLEYLKYPLNFVDNSTQKLYWRYSLFVKQLSITEEAYAYWKLLAANSQESGGLIDNQPASIKGNIKCVSHPDENVLGYFSVSSVSAKRIFTKDELRLYHSDEVFCRQFTRDNVGDFFQKLTEDQLPYYMAPVPEGNSPDLYFANQDCFDCRMKGGSPEVPEIWKE